MTTTHKIHILDYGYVTVTRELSSTGVTAHKVKVGLYSSRDKAISRMAEMYGVNPDDYGTDGLKEDEVIRARSIGYVCSIMKTPINATTTAVERAHARDS